MFSQFLYAFELYVENIRAYIHTERQTMKRLPDLASKFSLPKG